MTTKQVTLVTLLAAGLVTGGVVGFFNVKPPRSDQYCDVLPCTPCDLDGADPLMEDCLGEEGWLCCNNGLTLCALMGEGECPGMQLWCDDYEELPSGGIECHDEFGQGLQVSTSTGEVKK